MVRKLTIVAVVVFVRDINLQTFVGMWLMTIFLMIHVRVSPYKKQWLNNLEGFSLATICVTLNLSLLYSFPDVKENIIYSLGLTFGLLLLNLAVLAVFGVFMTKEAIVKALVILKSNKFTKKFFEGAKQVAQTIGTILPRFSSKTRASKTETE
eukprot:gene56877-biopygen102903